MRTGCFADESMTLQDYLFDAYPDISWFQRDTALALRIGAQRQTIHRYRLFKRFPSPEMISRIREATNGLVTAEDLLPPKFQADASRKRSARA